MNKKQADIVFVSGLDFSKNSGYVLQMGHSILCNILKPFYSVEAISFDNLNVRGILPYSDNLDETIDNMVSYIIDLNPKVVGFYTMCSIFQAVVLISEKLKEKAPDVFVFFGGPHATLTAEECMKQLPYLDLICLGESEKSILPLMNAIFTHRDFKDVPGVVYRDKGKIITTPCATLLTSEELTDYTVYHSGEEFESPNGRVMIEGGRGCPFNCTFCSTSSFWSRKFRIKPVDTMLAEMDKFHELTGKTEFAIEHDLFTANRGHLNDFCEKLIAKESPYIWRCSSRVDVLDSNIIEVMAKAGCKEIYLGVETGSPRMQKILKKNLDLSFVIDIIDCLVKNDINITVSFIYGFPEETEEDFLKTIDMIERIRIFDGVYIQLHRFMALPQTEETDKIIDEVYFDPNDVDLSIYNRMLENEKTLKLIRDHRELFIQFYTFKSLVRSKYPFIEGAMLMLSNGRNWFSGTTGYLVRQYHIPGLYIKYESFFKKIYYEYSEVYYQGKTHERTNSILRQIVEAEGNKQLLELLRYEEEMFSYRNKCLTEGHETEIKEYSIDISAAIKYGQFTDKSCKMLFKWDEDINTAKAVPIPDWMDVS